jgi:hypothetical protein
MAFSLVAHTGVQGTNAVYTLTSSAIDTTGADLLVVFSQIAGGTVTLSDSKSNTWNTLTQYSSANKIQISWCTPSSVGAGHTFTLTQVTAASTLFVQAWSGSHATQGAITESGHSYSGSSDTSMSTNSITPAGNGYLVVSGVSAGTGTIYSVDSSLALSDSLEVTTTGRITAAMAYYEQPTAGAINPTWSWTTGNYAATAIAAFKPAAAGGGRGLFIPSSNLNGVGSGGSFFQDRL